MHFDEQLEAVFDISIHGKTRNCSIGTHKLPTPPRYQQDRKGTHLILRRVKGCRVDVKQWTCVVPLDVFIHSGQDCGCLCALRLGCRRLQRKMQGGGSVCGYLLQRPVDEARYLLQLRRVDFLYCDGLQSPVRSLCVMSDRMIDRHSKAKGRIEV